MSDSSQGSFDLTVMSSVGHNDRLEMAAAGEGGGTLILAELGPPNKSIFVYADKRLQLERLLGRSARRRGGIRLQMLQHTEHRDFSFRVIKKKKNAKLGLR